MNFAGGVPVLSRNQQAFMLSWSDPTLDEEHAVGCRTRGAGTQQPQIAKGRILAKPLFRNRIGHGPHLAMGLVYIDLNRVRSGVVEHPAQ